MHLNCCTVKDGLESLKISFTLLDSPAKLDIPLVDDWYSMLKTFFPKGGWKTDLDLSKPYLEQAWTRRNDSRDGRPRTTEDDEDNPGDTGFHWPKTVTAARHCEIHGQLVDHLMNNLQLTAGAIGSVQIMLRNVFCCSVKLQCILQLRLVGLRRPWSLVRWCIARGRDVRQTSQMDR